LCVQQRLVNEERDMPDSPVLLCYDGSEDSKNAIAKAAELLGPRPAIVLSVVQDTRAVPPFAWLAPGEGLEELLADAQKAGARVAGEGVQVATSAGFTATPLVTETSEPVWAAVVEAADQHDVAAIVMGSRGLSGVKSAVIGSVSNGVVHHANRPTLVIRRTDA
jgi:nucleotide-binding universal stress UspA family protein